MLPEELRNIVSQFQFCGEVASLEKFGSGNINDTYRSIMHGPSGASYIHQKISQAVFPHPEQVMENMALVTGHIRKKLEQEQPNVRKTTLDLIPTKDGLPYYVDSCGEDWSGHLF